MQRDFRLNRAWQVLILIASLVSADAALGPGSGFTYQGRPTDGGTAANGSYNLQFKLYDTAVVGTAHRSARSSLSAYQC